MKNNKNTPVKSTKRNKSLEPLTVGNITAGYNEEIHNEDAIEFTYKLPLGAIKRLIHSYYGDMYSVEAEYIHSGSRSSSELGLPLYCLDMIRDIKIQLCKKGLDGQKIDDDVFRSDFEKDFKAIDRFRKNHHLGKQLNLFKPCNDPECCDQAWSLVRRIKTIHKLFRELLKDFRCQIAAGSKPHIDW